MGIRTKVFLVFGSFALLFSAIAGFIIWKTLFGGFLDVERTHIVEGALRARSAYENKIDEMGVNLSDWSRWDDTYQFAEDRNQAYVQSNLQPASVANLKINAIVYFALGGSVIDAAGFDPEAAASRNIPAGLLDFFRENPQFLHFENETDVKKGMITLPDGAFLLAVQPILKSDGTGPIRGAIVFGKFLGPEIVRQMADMTHLGLVFEPFDGPNLTESDRSIRESLLRGDEVAIQLSGENLALGHTLIRDMRGAPSIVLEAGMPRDIYAEGKRTTLIFIGIVSLIGVLFFIAVMLLVERIVLSKVIYLNAMIMTLQQQGLAGVSEIALPGSDELSVLASAMNNLLVMTRGTEAKLTDQANRLEVANTALNVEKERKEDVLRFLRSIGDGIVILGKDGRTIFMNEASERLLRHAFNPTHVHTPEELLKFLLEGEPPVPFVLPLQDIMAAGRIMSLPENTFLYGKDGVKVRIAGNISPILDEQKEAFGVVVLFRDVTDLRELDQMKSNFLSVAAHQLRTPLGSMRWNMEVLIDDGFGKLPKPAKEAVEQVYENTHRLITLVNDLLGVVRIDQKRSDEKTEPTDVCRLVREVAQTLEPEAKKQDVTIIFPDAVSCVILDIPPKRFYEAFENVLSNAIKYNRKGGTVTITSSADTESARIAITDTGIGIPKKDQERIFAKFFRSDNAVLKQADGSGLGLFVVKSFVEASGGTIRFESEENIGTTFTMEFPFKRSGK